MNTIMTSSALDLVSVIITCFNQEKFISKALDSILSQTYQNWECIVIDDGSTDHSAEVIKKYQDKDKRIHYHYQDNTGVSKARNAGFKLAKGKYIQYLDGDDLLLPEKFGKQMEVFNVDPEIHVCICDHQHLYLDKNKIEHYAFEEPVSFPLEQILYKWHNGLAFPNHAPLYKRCLWEKNEVPFPENYPHRSEDWVFNVLVALKGKKFYFLKEILCTYVMTGESYTSAVYNSASSAIYAAFYLNQIIPEKYRNNFLETTIRKSFSRYLESKKPWILNQSRNWKLGYAITRPFFQLWKIIRKL